MSKVVLVTGGSSGIGKSICEYLNTHGFVVYGTSRDPQRFPDSSIELLKLNVTDETSVRSCVEALVSKAGRIDILINNAGAGITGPLEEIPQNEIKRNFDINFHGPVSMIQSVLPVMREQKSGLIINITSIAAHMGLPYRGIYSASKAALEVLTEAIRMEVSGFNIKVVNLAPGDFATNIAAGRYHAPAREGSAYETVYSRVLRDIDADVNKGNDPIAVAKSVLKIINQSNPGPHQKVGAFMQKFSVSLKRLLPSRVFERLLKNHYKLK